MLARGRKLASNKRILLILLLAFAGAYSAKIVAMSNPLLINRYPFVSPDGFDWLTVTEGVWLAETLRGTDVSGVTLPVARPPVFVVIAAVDALLGQRGYALALVLGLSLFGTGYLVMRCLGEQASPSLSALALCALLLHPVNFVRSWILSDAVCVCLSLVATCYLFFELEKIQNGSSSAVRLVFSTLLITVAGLTQTYGLIAPLIGSIVLAYLGKEEESFSNLYNCFVCHAVCRTLGAAFVLLVPFLTTPVET